MFDFVGWLVCDLWVHGVELFVGYCVVVWYI